MSRAEATPFVRDRLTWLCYLSLSAYAFYLYALGPVVNFLRQELHLSYTLTSLHSSLWAAGAVAVGVSFHALARGLGRHRLLWLSALATAAGALLLIAGHQAGITLTAALVLGVGGTSLGSVSSAALADRHGIFQDRALVEANAGATATAVAVPALFGLLALTAAGWRLGMVVPLLTLAVLFLVLRRVPLPPQPVAPIAAARLTGRFWGYCLLVAMVVAIEFCIVFYGVPLLGLAVHLSTADAATVMSLFFAGELTARLVGSRLTRHPGRAPILVGVALGVALAGFLVLWVSRALVLACAALFVTGLGAGNLYPLSLSLALASGGGRTDQAMARTQMAVGLAVGTSTPLLGVLSDHVGVLGALTLEPCLILVAAVALVALRSGSPRPAQPVGA